METRASSETRSVSVNEVEVETSDDHDNDARYSLLDIANYISLGTYPGGADKVTKCSIRKGAKLEGGHLHYVSGKVKKTPRLVVKNEEE